MQNKSYVKEKALPFLARLMIGFQALVIVVVVIFYHRQHNPKVLSVFHDLLIGAITWIYLSLFYLWNRKRPARHEGSVYLSLFAKTILVLGPAFFLIIGAIIYPERQHEAQRYVQAPVCSEEALDSEPCRLMTQAEWVSTQCRHRYFDSHPENDVCQVELRVAGQSKFLSLLRPDTQPFKPNTSFLIEMFEGRPTAVQLENRLVPNVSSPDRTLQTLKMSVLVWIGLMALSALYLWKYRKRKL